MSPPPTRAAPVATRHLHDPRVLIPLSMAALYLIWGSTYLGIHYALESYPPFLLAGLRFLCAGGALYGFLRLRGTPAPSAVQWRNAAFSSVFLLGLGNGLVCFAEQRVGSGIAAVAVASMPLFAVLFTGMYGEWANRRETVGLLIGFAGVALLAWDKASFKPDASGVAPGWAVLACLLACICYGISASYTKRYLSGLPPLVTAAGSQIGATLGLFLPALWLWPARMPGASAWLALLAVGVVCGFGADSYRYALDAALARLG